MPYTTGKCVAHAHNPRVQVLQQHDRKAMFGHVLATNLLQTHTSTVQSGQFNSVVQVAADPVAD